MKCSLSIYLSICLSVCLSVCLSIYIFWWMCLMQMLSVCCWWCWNQFCISSQQCDSIMDSVHSLIWNVKGLWTWAVSTFSLYKHPPTYIHTHRHTDTHTHSYSTFVNSSDAMCLCLWGWTVCFWAISNQTTNNISPHHRIEKTHQEGLRDTEERKGHWLYVSFTNLYTRIQHL